MSKYVRIIAQEMGLGNQIQFIPVIKALQKKNITVISNSPIYDELGILKNGFDRSRKSCINLTVFGYDWKRVLKSRLKYPGKLYGFKYRVKGKMSGIGYTQTLDFDPAKNEVENNMRLLKFVGIEDNDVDFSIERTRQGAVKGPAPDGPGLTAGEIIEKSVALGVSNKPGKSYPHWQELANLLKKDGYDVFAFGDDKIKNAINPPTPTLTELRDWLSRMQYYIGVDSGIMHIADALKIPMVVMFGATHVNKNQPYNKPNVVLKPNIECAPCYGIWGHVDCFQNPRYQCMFYSPQEVYEAWVKLRNQ